MAATHVKLTNNSVLVRYADQYRYAMEVNGGALLNHSRLHHNCPLKKLIVNGHALVNIYVYIENLHILVHKKNITS